MGQILENTQKSKHIFGIYDYKILQSLYYINIFIHWSQKELDMTQQLNNSNIYCSYLCTFIYKHKFLYECICVHVYVSLYIYMYEGFPGGSVVKNPPAEQERQEMRVQSLGQEHPLEEGMATYSSILAWRIPWTEEPGGLYGPQGHKESDTTEVMEHAHMHVYVCMQCHNNNLKTTDYQIQYEHALILMTY